jgi:hypothetical protein
LLVDADGFKHELLYSLMMIQWYTTIETKEIECEVMDCTCEHGNEHSGSIRSLTPTNFSKMTLLHTFRLVT